MEKRFNQTSQQRVRGPPGLQPKQISLINTEGKAYVMVILNRVRTYLEAQLLDAQHYSRASGNSVAHQMPYSANGA